MMKILGSTTSSVCGTAGAGGGGPVRCTGPAQPRAPTAAGLSHACSGRPGPGNQAPARAGAVRGLACDGGTGDHPGGTAQQSRPHRSGSHPVQHHLAQPGPQPASGGRQAPGQRQPRRLLPSSGSASFPRGNVLFPCGAHGDTGPGTMDRLPAAAAASQHSPPGHSKCGYPARQPSGSTKTRTPRQPAGPCGESPANPTPIPPQRRRPVPIANQDRLVEPDRLGTTIKLSFPEGPARRLRNVNAAGVSQRSQARLTPILCW